MRGLRSDSQLPRNLFHAVAVDIFPLQRVAVVRRQSVQRHLDQPRHLKASIVILGLTCGRRLQRIHGSLQIRRIFREYDVLAVSRQSFEVIVQLTPAYRAQPREQRGLASVGMQLLNGLRKRDVNNLPGGIQVIAKEHGIRTIIDLRTAEDAEAIEAERLALADSDLTYIHLPMRHDPAEETR